MAGFIIGFICGALELLILTRIVRAVSLGDTGRVALLALAKLLILGAAFVPVILFYRTSLLWCGVGISLPLVLGPFINMFVSKNNKEGTKS